MMFKIFPDYFQYIVLIKKFTYKVIITCVFLNTLFTHVKFLTILHVYFKIFFLHILNFWTSTYVIAIFHFRYIRFLTVLHV